MIVYVYENPKCSISAESHALHFLGTKESIRAEYLPKRSTILQKFTITKEMLPALQQRQAALQQRNDEDSEPEIHGCFTFPVIFNVEGAIERSAFFIRH